MNMTHDYMHHYRGYWSDGGKCRIEIYREEGRSPMVICSQLQDNENTSVTNMAEYLAAEVVEEHSLLTPLTWVEHYPEHEGEIGEYSLVRFSSWELTKVCLGGAWRYRNRIAAVVTPAPRGGGGAHRGRWRRHRQLTATSSTT